MELVWGVGDVADAEEDASGGVERPACSEDETEDFEELLCSSDCAWLRRRFFPREVFCEAYELVAALRRRGASPVQRVVATLEALPAFAKLELCAAALALPHVLQALESPEEWVALGEDAAAALAELVLCVGARLGSRLAQSALVPRVAKVLEHFLSAAREDDECQRDASCRRARAGRALFARGDALWQAVLRTAGPDAFCRLLVPILVEQVVRDGSATPQAFECAEALLAPASNISIEDST